MRQHGQQLSQLVFLVFAVFLTLLYGCQRSTATISGVSVPVPEEMKKIADKDFQKIPGYNVQQATFEGKATGDVIFRFYQENMAAKGWVPNAVLGGGEGKIAYTKDNKVLLITYQTDPAGITTLVLMVGTQPS